MKKRFLAIIMTVFMLLNLLPAGVFAAEIIDSGTCGENLTWTFDSNGVLTISGEGEMDESPWRDSYTDTIKTVVIEKGVTSIDSSAFYWCPSLIEVTIPESVISIGSHAFSGCALTNITIPRSVATIGYNAFSHCSSLTKIVIPASVSSIEPGAFSGCSSVQEVVIDENNDTYCTDEYGVIFNKDKTYIHSSIIHSVEKYDIPGTVTTIEEDAFYNRYALYKLTIPSSVTEIKKNAFSACYALSHVVFEGKAPSIGENAFQSCGIVKSYYPDDESWTEEVRQNYGGTITWIPASEGGFATGILTWTLSEEGVLTISGKGKMEDFESYLERPWNDVASDIKEVVIEEGVTSIGNYAFCNCTSLTEVSIPESVTSIGDNAFIYCPAFSSCEHGWTLVHEKVESTCTESGYEAIYKCLNCGEIKGGEYIEPHSWGEWSTTKDATCGEDGTKERTCMACSEVEQGIIPATGDHSWSEWTPYVHTSETAEGEVCQGCTMEGTRSCPVCGSVQTSERRHLRVPGMSDDYGVTVPESVYMGETFDMTVRFPEIPITKAATIDAMIEFDNTKVEIMELSIGNVTGGYTMFTDVEDANRVGFVNFSCWSSENSIDLSKGLVVTGLFKSKESVENVDFKVSKFYVETIDESTGLGIELIMIEDIETDLTIEVVDPRIDFGTTGDLTWALDINGILTITGSGAMADYDQEKAPWYKNADKVKTITIDNTVTHIGNNAFSGLTGVESIVIPESITSIGENAFSGCEGLDLIEFMGNAPAIAENAFADVKADAKYFTNKEWTKDQKADYGGNLDWKEVQKEIASSGTCGPMLTWTLDVDGELTISGTGDMDDYGWTPWGDHNVYSVVIKDGVTSIGDCAFMYLGALKSVKIPDSVTRIGYSAFERCRNLTSIDLPENITTIEEWTFYGTGLTSVKIPKGVTSIGQAAFFSCDSLVDVTIPNTVTKIDDSAFLGCSNLKSIEIPDSVTSLGSLVFSNCYELTAVELSENITEIGLGAFANCSKLEVITLPEALESFGSDVFRRSNLKEYKIDSGNKNFSVKDGILYSYDGTKLVSYPYAKELKHLEIPDTVTTIAYRSFCDISTLGGVTIPDSVKSIENRAFSNCTGITSLTIPGSVETIGNRAFSNNNLTELTFEKGIKTIGESAFAGSDFTTIVIPEGVTSIGERAFEECYELKEVTIFNGPTYLGEYVFGWCSSLETVTLPESVKEIHPNAFYGCNSLKNINGESFTSIDGVLFSKDGKTLIRYLSSSDAETFVIPEGTEVIGQGAFTGNGNLLTIRIPDTVKEISDEAFYNCYSLQNIVIPGSVKSIGDYAFSRCWNLNTVEIKSGVESIGENAFLYCESLKDINLPDSITSIGQSAFEGCRLKEIILPKGLKEIPASMFYECYNLEEVTIQSGVEYIGNNAFANCSSLKKVSIPDTVKSMAHSVFTYCYNLTDVKLPAGLGEIPKNTFRGCEKLKTINIPGGVKSIGSSAFDGCYTLTNIKIPDSVTEIGDNVFSWCTNLETVNIPKSVTSIAYNMFEGCSSLKSLDIPDSVTSINTGAFGYCTSLKDISIPESVTEIGETVFIDCDELESIALPKDVTALYATFVDCDKLTDVTLPENLEILGRETFMYCSNLETLTIPASTNTIGRDALYDCTNLSKIYFEGNAPDSFDADQLGYCSPDLELYYVEGRTGWTDSPAYNAEEGTWYGYPLNKLEVTMSIKALPILLEYDEWAKSVDPAGGKIEISYGEKTNVVDMTKEMLSGFVPAKLGTQTITVTYGDNTATFEIKVTHVYAPPKVTEPTCTEKGYTTHTCLACKQTYKDSFIDALGHKEVIDKAAEATCSSTGLTEGKHCSVCSEVLTKQEIIPKKDHTPKVVGSIEATCDKDGYTGDTVCEVCNHKIATGTVIVAKGHEPVFVDAKAPTYSEDGNIAHYACECGTLFSDEEGKEEITDKTTVIIPKLVKVEEGKAEVSTDAVADAIEKAEESDTVKIPIFESEDDDDDETEGGTEGGTEEKPKVTTTVIPSESITAVVEAEKAIEIETKSYTVTLDNKALEAVNDVITSAGEEAPAKNVEIKVNEVEEESLTEKQQEVLETHEVAVVISMEIVCNEEKVTDFNGGTMTVKIPFEPKEGTKGEDYTVLYVADDGHIEYIKTRYENGHIVMELEHLSDYVIVNKLSAIVFGDANGDGVADAKDATQILRYANGKSSAFDQMDEAKMLASADVNADKTVDAKDATQILRYVNGKTSVFDNK